MKARFRGRRSAAQAVARPLTLIGITAFAERIMGRYANRRTPLRPAALVFRLPTPTAQPIAYHVHIRPRLELSLGRWRTVTRGTESDGPAVSPAVPALRVEPITLRSTTHEVTTSRVRELIERVAVTSSRHEHTTRSTTMRVVREGHESPLASTDGRARPVPARVAAPELVLRRAPAQATAVRSSPNTAGPEDAAVPARPAVTASAPLDVNRLTDEVIRAIDRRIVAQRERLGRG